MMLREMSVFVTIRGGRCDVTDVIESAIGRSRLTNGIVNLYCNYDECSIHVVSSRRAHAIHTPPQSGSLTLPFLPVNPCFPEEESTFSMK